MNSCRFTVSLIILACFQILNGQNKSVMNFTEDDGLPGNMVFDVLKDNKGIIWVATNNGVAQYDGDKFTPVNDFEGKPLLMARAMACGSGDTVYAGSFKGGLAIIRNDTIKKIIHNRNGTSDRIRKLCYNDYYKFLLVGTEGGFYILKDTLLIPVSIAIEKKAKPVVTSIAYRDSLIYFTVADYGIYKLIVNREYPERPYAIKVFSHSGYSSLLEDNTIFATQFNRIFSFSLNEPSIYSLWNWLEERVFIWTLSAYKNGGILIGCIGDERFRGGVMIYSPGQNSCVPLINDGNIQTVNSIYYDSKDDIVWIARDNGLTAVFESPFEHTAITGDKAIIDIGIAGDSLYVLTSEGVFLKKKDEIIPLFSRESLIRTIDSYFRNAGIVEKPYLFDNRGFKELISFETSEGRLFVSTQRGAISIPDLRTYLPFAAGTFHLAGEKSAFSQVQYVPLRFFPSYRDSISWIEPEGKQGTVKDIEEIIESKGIFYCRSLINGLYIIKDNAVFRLSDAGSEIENYMIGMDKDPDGKVWCVSGNGNLYETGFSDSAFVERKLDLLNTGYAGNVCKWIKFNGDYLYVGTNKGLNIIRRSKLVSENPVIDYSFNENNGYDFISAKSPVSDRKGTIYLHTNKEVVSVDTFFRSSGKNELHIRNLSINGKVKLLPHNSEISLRFDQKQVEFTFNVVKYPSSRNFRYRYKVNSETWIAGNRVLLQSLRPGRYEIAMEGFNTENMSTIYEKMGFMVRPPFWRSWWFIILLIFTSTLLFFTYLRFRIKRLNRQHDEKTKLIIQNSELQLRSLQIQMNPHFIFNALNAIQAFIMEKNTEDSIRYLNDLSGIIRTNLENATEEYIYLSREIEFLKKYIQIEEMRFNNNLQVEFSECTEQSAIKLPPMLIQPVIENAIKHGVRNKEGLGIIKIGCTRSNDVLSVTVEDNGAGREFTESIRHKSHNPLSLKIIKQRLDLLNEKYHTDKHNISFTDLKKEGVSTGTRVVINLLCS